MSEQENKKVPVVSAEKKADKPHKAKKPSLFARAKKWFRELRSETKKVVWPNRSQVTKNTIIVISTVLIIGIFIWVLDFILNFGVQFLIKLL